MSTSITILLPFRDAAPTLPECLDSIEQQSLRSFELLAVDDCSQDHGPQLVRERARRDTRIRLLSNPGRGLVAALNYGLRRASKPLIARMDADDRMLPERLALQSQYLIQHPGVTLVASQVAAFPEHHLLAGFREYLRWQNQCLSAAQVAEQIYVESPFAHPSVMFRREPVLTVGAYREGEFPEDYDLWLRLHHAGHFMAKIPQVLLHWRDSEKRLSRTDPRCSRDAFDQLRATYLARDPRLRSDRPLAFWGAGRKTRRRANLLIQRGFPPTVWIDIDPRKIGNRLRDVPVVGPEWLRRRLRPFVLSYVTNHGARDWIVRYLQRLGYAPGRDYLCVG